MMRNANKFWLVCAIIVCALALAATAYAGFRLVGFEVAKPKRQMLPDKALRDLQKSDKASISVVSMQIPPAIAPQVYSLAAGIGAGEKDVGFILFWDPEVYDNADKLGREVTAIGISGGDYQGTMILQSPKGAVVASPKGLFTPDPPLWWNNFGLSYEMLKEAFDNLESGKTKLITDESFKIDFKENVSADVLNSKWTQVGYDRDGNKQNGATSIPAVFNRAGMSREEAKKLDTVLNEFNANEVFLWGYGNKTYEFSSAGLARYDAHIDSVIKNVYVSPILPFAPPLLHLAILLCIFALLLVMFVLGRYHDFALSSFSAFLAIILAGGASLLLDGRIAPEIVPLASLIGAGIVWTVPVLFLSISYGLDLATGWYWLFFALLSASSIMSIILPAKWVWLGLEILLGILILFMFAGFLARKNKKSTA